MTEKIELPKCLFPAYMVEIIGDTDSKIEGITLDAIDYQIIIYGFDGNELYNNKETNIYCLRDVEDDDLISDVGDFLCETWRMEVFCPNAVENYKRPNDRK